jgi:two-component system, OmpR family, response regulator
VKILLVEDDEAIGIALQRGLTEEGHTVDWCTRGRTARDQAQQIDYDVVVLDWSLPDYDGLHLLRDWRERGLHVPVLMLTARGSVPERVLGLREGADDYVVKPFDFDELLARLEALFRRAEGTLETGRVGSVELDARRRVLRRAREEQPLTPREYALAAELFRHRGEVMTRRHLLEHVWGTDYDTDANVLDVYVGYLRRKLERLAADDVELRAVRGVGFRLVAREETKG